MQVLIEALVHLSDGLGFWATLVLFAVILSILILMARAQVQRGATDNKIHTTEAIARAYTLISELRPKLKDAEFEKAKKKILTNYGITETQEGPEAQVTPDQEAVRRASIFGALTPPGLYLLLALLSGDVPGEFWAFVVAVVFLVPPVYGGVKAISNRINMPKHAYWQGFFYSAAILLAEMMLLVMIALQARS